MNFAKAFNQMLIERRDQLLKEWDAENGEEFTEARENYESCKASIKSGSWDSVDEAENLAEDVSNYHDAEKDFRKLEKERRQISHWCDQFMIDVTEQSA